MSDFNSAIHYLLPIEGGVSENPHDMGGTTKFGISYNFLKLINPNATEMDVLNLTKEKAVGIYEQYFWDQYRIYEFMEQKIANKFFNMIVNMPPAEAIKVMQSAVNEINILANLIIDGVLGPKTRSYINLCNPTLLLLAIKIKQAEYYLNVVDKLSSQAVFLMGWLRRALDD